MGQAAGHPGEQCCQVGRKSMGHETGRGGHWGSISCQVTETTLGLSLPEWHHVSPVPSARLQAPAERELGMGFRALCLCNGKQGQRLVRVSRASGGAASCWRMCRVCTSHGSLEHVGLLGGLCLVLAWSGTQGGFRGMDSTPHWRLPVSSLRGRRCLFLP